MNTEMKPPTMIIIERHDYGWSATFYGFERIPDDIETPLPFTSAAIMPDVIGHLRRRFPAAQFKFRRDNKLHSIAASKNPLDNAVSSS